MELTAATDQFQKAARAIKAAGDGAIQKQATIALRDIARPYGKYVLLAGAQQLPKRGGLSYRVAGSAITSDTSGTMRVTISLSNRKGYALRAMDNGTLRHPTFGHKPWESQTIRAGIFTTPFQQGAPQIRTAMVTAINKVLRQVASSV